MKNMSKLESKDVKNKNKYLFPFNAYDIQNQFMDALYDSLDNRKVSVLESPTGTGKSLSIICAAFKWIQDFEEKEFKGLSLELQELNEEIKTLDTESKTSCHWIEIQDKKSMLCRHKDLIVKQLNAFDLKFERNKTLVDRNGNSFVKKTIESMHKKVNKKLKSDFNCDTDLDSVDNQSDEDVVDYCSDDEVVADRDESEEGKGFVRPKIYYCSRTHSQLSQFISEIKKTSFSRQQRPLRAVPLASRSSYCINDKVLKLNNNYMINEKCIELQNTSKREMKCQFMTRKPLIDEFKDEILSDVMDIEDINKIGKAVKACPYYSTRKAIPEAEIVILPYNILLHSATRESFGVDLKDSVVIVDEAHNLIETIYNIHSIELKGWHVIDALTQLNNYLLKYKTRLSARNTMHIKQIIYILNEFLKYFKAGAQTGCPNVTERVDFLIRLGIENLNLYKILEFCQRSGITRKLFGFCEKQKLMKSQNKTEDNTTLTKGMTGTTGTTAFLAKMKNKKIEIQTIASESPNTEEEIKIFGSPLYLIQDFLRSLVNTKTIAKIITNCDKNSIRNSSLKYILLNPGSFFEEIVSKCRSVVLCGGTMRPFDQYIDHLFKPLGVSSDRLMTFSCGHVIPDSNLLAVALGVGPNQMALNYTFMNRNNKSLIEETGKTIVNFCSIIPGGIVCFFSSYELEDLYYKNWDNSSIIKTIESKGKRVFREPKKASLVASTLADYSRAISTDNKKGAILMCVIGGKMSEGINFSDHLGRGVVVVGLPYPNQQSIELQQRMTYLSELKPNSGNVYYQNLCLKAVNQSIGRAIRHKDDFAVILLLDNRYVNKQSIRQNLPNWITSRLICADSFGKAFASVRQFFANK